MPEEKRGRKRTVRPKRVKRNKHQVGINLDKDVYDWARLYVVYKRTNMSQLINNYILSLKEKHHQAVDDFVRQQLGDDFVHQQQLENLNS